MKNLIIFEDDKFINFLPLVHLRPVYELRTGIFTLRQKIELSFKNYEVEYFCRKGLEDLKIVQF